jgi:hypothetical protein
MAHVIWQGVGMPCRPASRSTAASKTSSGPLLTLKHVQRGHEHAWPVEMGLLSLRRRVCVTRMMALFWGILAGARRVIFYSMYGHVYKWRKPSWPERAT